MRTSISASIHNDYPGQLGRLLLVQPEVFRKLGDLAVKEI
jgi:hypothetical protein